MSAIESKIVQHDRSLSVASFRWMQARAEEKHEKMKIVNRLLDARLELMAERDEEANL